MRVRIPSMVMAWGVNVIWADLVYHGSHECHWNDSYSLEIPDLSPSAHLCTCRVEGKVSRLDYKYLHKTFLYKKDAHNLNICPQT